MKADMGGCTSKTSNVQQPELPVMIESTAAERALANVKAIFDSIAKDAEGSVSKIDFINTLGPNASIRALIKEAGLNQNWGAMGSTRTEDRVTWEEVEANLTRMQTPREPGVQVEPAVEAIAEKKAEEAEALAHLGSEEQAKRALAAADEKAIEHVKKIFRGLEADGGEAVSKKELATSLAQDELVVSLVREAAFNPQFCTLEHSESHERITWDEFEAHLRGAAQERTKLGQESMAAVEMQREEGEEANGVVAPKGVWCSC